MLETPPANHAIAHATWEEAVQDFLLPLSATKAAKTVRFYDCQLKQLLKWTGGNPVALEIFGKRHLDRYLAERAKTVSRTTLRHDAVAAKSFFKWCAKNDLLAHPCLKERRESQERLEAEVKAWQVRRNAARVEVDWQFTTDDARVKLKRLYLQILTS